MKNLLILIYSLFLVSCAPEHLDYCVKPNKEFLQKCEITLKNHEEWLLASTHFAIDFWKIHQVEFIIVDGNGLEIFIGKLPEEQYGKYFIPCGLSLCEPKIILSEKIVGLTGITDNIELLGRLCSSPRIRTFFRNGT